MQRPFFSQSPKRVGSGPLRPPSSGGRTTATAGAGGADSCEAQPFYVNSPYGICLAHNGNLTNANELAEMLVRSDLRHLHTGSDSEVLLNVLAHELQRLGKQAASPRDIFNAVRSMHRRVRGGYAVVAMIVGHGMLGFRDPNAIRPLVLGRRDTRDGRSEWMLASESVALDALALRDDAQELRARAAARARVRPHPLGYAGR